MYRISIAPFDEVVQLSNNVDELDNTTAVYEAGMITVLRQMAYVSLTNREIAGGIENKTDEYNAANRKISYLMDQFQNKEQRSLILEMEENINLVNLLDCEEHFIQGFIEGYKFVKEYF